jgi:hypothetical protein
MYTNQIKPHRVYASVESLEVDEAIGVNHAVGLYQADLNAPAILSADGIRSVLQPPCRDPFSLNRGGLWATGVEPLPSVLLQQ